MSKTVQVTTQIKNEEVLIETCEEFGYEFAKDKEVQMYSTRERGFAISLPGFRYPVVVDLKTGDVKSDTYGGSWGDEKELNRFKTRYSEMFVNKAVESANDEGRHMVISSREEDEQYIRIRIEA